MNVLDGWHLGSEETVRFIERVDIFALDPDIKLESTLNDLHDSLPSTPFSLSMSRLTHFVQGAFQSQRRARYEEPESEERGERRRSKRIRD